MSSSVEPGQTRETLWSDAQVCRQNFLSGTVQTAAGAGRWPHVGRTQVLMSLIAIMLGVALIAMAAISVGRTQAGHSNGEGKQRSADTRNSSRSSRRKTRIRRGRYID